MNRILILALLVLGSVVSDAQNIYNVLTDIQNYKLVTLPNGFRVQVVTSSEYKYCNCRLSADVSNIDEGSKTGIKQVVAAITGSDDIADEVIVKNMVSHAQALDSLLEFMAGAVYGNSIHNLDFHDYKQRRTEYLTAHQSDIETILSDAATNQVGLQPLKPNFMDNISEADYTEFRRCCFSPDRCLLTICSALDVADIQEVVSKYFGGQEKVVAKTKSGSVSFKPKDVVYFINDSVATSVNIAFKDYFPCQKSPKNFVLNKVAQHLLFGEYFPQMKDYSTYNYDLLSLDLPDAYDKFGYITRHLYHPRNEDYLIDTSLETAKSEAVSSFKQRLKYPDFACELAQYILLYKLPANFFSQYEASVNAVTEEDALSFIKTINKNGADVMVINGNQQDLHCALTQLAANRETDIVSLNMDVNYVFPKGFGAKSIFNSYMKVTGLVNVPKNLSFTYKTVYDYFQKDEQYKAGGRVLRKSPNMYLLENYVLHDDTIKVFHYKEIFDGTTPFDSTQLYGLVFVDEFRTNVLKQKASFPHEPNYDKLGIEYHLICDYELFKQGYFKVQIVDLNKSVSYNYYNIYTGFKDKVEMLDSDGKVWKIITYEYEKSEKYQLPKIIREQTAEMRSETLFSAYDMNTGLKKQQFAIGIPGKKK